MTTLTPQTHARSLVSAYAATDRLNIQAPDNHRAALWLDRHGITVETIDEFVSDSVVLDMQNPLIKALNMPYHDVRVMQQKHDFQQIGLLRGLVLERSLD